MKNNFIPTLFWITGLSGAGKTTLGSLLTRQLRARGDPVVFLDGDLLREAFGNGFGHDRNGRFDASLQYARLCKILVEQNIHIVCATISMFHRTQNWNRQHIKHYLEIFLDIPLEELEKRDSKSIYSLAKLGKLNNVVGIDIEPEFPKSPDIIIQDDKEAPETSVERILKQYDLNIYSSEEVNGNTMELY